MHRKLIFILAAAVITTLGLLAGLGIIPSAPAPQVTRDTAK
jgi:hypothetical protein